MGGISGNLVEHYSAPRIMNNVGTLWRIQNCIYRVIVSVKNVNIKYRVVGQKQYVVKSGTLGRI